MSKKLFSPKFKITQPMLGGLMKIEKARGFLEAARLSDQWIKKMSRSAFLLETHHTTHIEGTRLSLEQSAEILAGRRPPGADKEDIKEVKNYKDAFDLMLNYLKKESAVKESLVKEIHKELVKGVRGNRAQPGRYRDLQNYVGNAMTGEIIYTPPKPEAVPALMKDFVRWINQETKIHPVLKSGIIQFQFVHIHPFVDGNGRASRLLCAFYLYKSDYDFKRLFSISEYYDKDRKSFYSAIQSVRESGMDMTFWLEYFVQGLLSQMSGAVEAGKKVIFKDALMQNHNLSQRQGLVIEHILENGKLLPKDFEELCSKMSGPGKAGQKQTISKVTKRTLQRDLKDMADKKIIEAEGKTNRQFYRLSGKG